MTAATAAALAGLAHFGVGLYGFANPDMTKNMFGDEAVWIVPAFFLVLGSFQLVWAWATLGYREPTMIGIGVAGFIGSIILYLVALVTPLTAFGVKQQTLTTLSAVPFTVKFIEIVYIIAVVSTMRLMTTEEPGQRVEKAKSSGQPAHM